MIASKGGLGSAGSGVTNFLGGLALGKLKWNVGPHGCCFEGCELMSGLRLSGWVSTSVAVVIVKKGNCTGGSGRLQDKSSLHQSPLMLIWASCRSDLVAAVVRY